jgi:hypothetical protein
MTSKRFKAWTSSRRAWADHGGWIRRAGSFARTPRLWPDRVRGTVRRDRTGLSALASPYVLAAAAAALASALTYALDSKRGTRRRALLLDRWMHGMRDASKVLRITARDVRHRVRGALCEMRARLQERHVDDVVLRERVRAELGRASTHPGAIEVRCEGDMCRLEGPILENEVTSVLRSVARVRGVREVQNHLDVHRDAGRVPGLQGDVAPR